MLAQFHLAAQSYPQQMDNEFDLVWQKNTVEDWLHNIPTEDATLLQSELAHQLSIQTQTQALPFGIIHGDLFRDNSLFIESQHSNKPSYTLSAILDLYTACNDTLLIDLAIVINDWCFKSNELDTTLTSNVISAYQSIRPLENIEKEAFNNILRASALRFWILRLDLKYNPRKRDMDSEKISPNTYNPDEYKQKLLKHIEDKGQFMRLLSDV